MPLFHLQDIPRTRNPEGLALGVLIRRQQAPMQLSPRRIYDGFSAGAKLVQLFELQHLRTAPHKACEYTWHGLALPLMRPACWHPFRAASPPWSFARRLISGWPPQILCSSTADRSSSRLLARCSGTRFCDPHLVIRHQAAGGHARGPDIHILGRRQDARLRHLPR